MSRDGLAALPRGATGLSAVCDCGISWSYSLTIFGIYHICDQGRPRRVCANAQSRQCFRCLQTQQRDADKCSDLALRL